MKNNRRKLKTTSKNTGFYAAIYTMIGALALVALVFAYSNVVKTPNEKLADVGETSKLNVAGVNVPLDQSFKGAEKKGGLSSSIILGEDFDLKADELARKKKEKENKDVMPETPSETPTESEDPKPEAAIDEIIPEQKSIDKVDAPKNNLFTSFDENTVKMNWPIVGEVVLEFSNDKLIYDKTLEQYRTNETVRIAAPVGTEVFAAAEGIVKGVESDHENGNFVVIDHGNGWTTTYSQLQAKVLVVPGDIVSAQQIIGGVGEPSMPNVVLGNHIGFNISKDQLAINPVSVVE